MFHAFAQQLLYQIDKESAKYANTNIENCPGSRVEVEIKIERQAEK